MNRLTADREQFVALAADLAQQRETILQAWRTVVAADPQLTTASTISRTQFNDHIPEVLDAFEKELSQGAVESTAEQHGAAEHGLLRWQQGYDQKETMREWGHLHLCVLDAIERYGAAHPELDASVMSEARRALVRLCNGGVCESAARFFWLQRAEAAARVRELKIALDQLKALERERAEAWREAAHDLRGSVSVISSAAAIVSRDGVQDPMRTRYSQILHKGVVSLHDLLSDLMSLARLEAGHDRRNVASFDVATLMHEFCDSMRPMASERGLFLRCEGAESLIVDGDAAKVRRIAQNLVLNALNVTKQGGVTVSWQAAETTGVAQWALSIQDTGPGFKQDSAPLVVLALQEATKEAQEVEERAEDGDSSAATEMPASIDSQSTPRTAQHGEGIGLSIVKRLCEVLDATLELQSDVGKGTTFRVVIPRVYPR